MNSSHSYSTTSKTLYICSTFFRFQNICISAENLSRIFTIKRNNNHSKLSSLQFQLKASQVSVFSLVTKQTKFLAGRGRTRALTVLYSMSDYTVHVVDGVFCNYYCSPGIFFVSAFYFSQVNDCIQRYRKNKGCISDSFLFHVL